MTMTSDTLPLDPAVTDAPPSPADQGTPAVGADEPKSRPAPKDSRPRKRPAGSTTKSAAKGPGRPSKSTQRVERIGSALAGLGVGITLLHPADGLAVVAHSPGIAQALGRLADENPRIARYLDTATEGGAWLGVAIAVTPLALTIAANHGLLPEGAAQVLTQGAAPGGDAGLAQVLTMFDTGAEPGA